MYSQNWHLQNVPVRSLSTTGFTTIIHKCHCLTRKYCRNSNRQCVIPVLQSFIHATVEQKHITVLAYTPIETVLIYVALPPSLVQDKLNHFVDRFCIILYFIPFIVFNPDLPSATMSVWPMIS